MLTLEQLQGQELFIESMNLEKDDHQITLSLGVLCKGSICNLIFHNVSSLFLDNLSFPLQISGFRVIDNLCNGWQSDIRYKVHDFEDNKICFYCTSLEILP